MYCFLWARCNQIILNTYIRWPCQLRNITLTNSINITVNLITKPRYMHTFYWANWWCICLIKHICCFQCFKIMVKVLANFDFLNMILPHQCILKAREMVFKGHVVSSHAYNLMCQKYKLSKTLQHLRQWPMCEHS
jgi:hypothetical protein